NSERQSALQGHDAVGFPTPDELAENTLGIAQEPMTRSKGQSDNEAAHEAMGDVETGQGFLRRQIVEVLNSPNAVVRFQPARQRIGVAQEFGPGVRALSDSRSDVLHDSNLQGVIVGVCRLCSRILETLKLGVRPEKLTFGNRGSGK